MIHQKVIFDTPITVWSIFVAFIIRAIHVSKKKISRVAI